jgi:Fe-S oxidoreductase
VAPSALQIQPISACRIKQGIAKQTIMVFNTEGPRKTDAPSKNTRQRVSAYAMRRKKMALHPLIDPKMLDTIRQTGKTNEQLPDRVPLLEEYGLPYDREADSAVITGCQILAGLPGSLAALSRILEQGNVSHTFLSQEYCCGNNLYRPAIKARDEEALSELRSISKDFVAKNIELAETLSVKRLIIFCSPCYPIYKHAFPDMDILFYPAAIDEAVSTLSLDRKVDYYAGCYKLHKRFAPVPMDLKSTNHVLAKIDGLEINRIKAPACCYKPDGLAHMIDGVKTDCMVHICSGCYFQALLHMPKERGVTITMLPEFVEEAIASS